MSRRLVAGLDIETTGLDQTDGHRIIEAAVIVHDLDTRAELLRYETRINPQRGVDPKAQEVHGISYDMLIGQPLWESVAPRLSAILSKCQYVVAHNGQGFDMPFVWGEFLRAGVSMPEVIVVDTMIQGRWATPDGAIPNLGALCFASGVDYDKSKAHGATYDVSVMLSCFFRHFDSGFFHLPTEAYRYTVPKPKEKKT
jgi:DNA polymerase-3 subunit epsilon